MSEEAKWTDEENRNVVGVFKILLDVDKRINPQIYKKENMEKDEEIEDLPEEEETRRLMQEHDIDADTAEKAQDLINEGLDEDEAIELAEDF